MIATGIENLDPAFWRDLSIAIVSLAGFALVVKRLFWPSTVSPQPLIIALEKEFINKHDFEKFEKYVHTSHHDIKGEINAVKLRGDDRDETLAKLDERSQSQQRSIDNLSIKIDRVVDRVADKVESLLKHRGPIK